MTFDKGHQNKTGIRLRSFRDKKGLSQQEVADATGSTRDKITNFETGRANPKHKDLIALAEFFHTTIDYLVGTTDDPLPWYSRLSLDFKDLLAKMSKDGEFFDYLKPDILEEAARFKDQFEDDFSYTPNEFAGVMDEDYSLFFKSELYGDIVGIAIKHGLVEGKNKNPDPLANEKEFIGNIELSDDELIKKFNMTIDGHKLDEKQMKRLIAFARMDRENN